MIFTTMEESLSHVIQKMVGVVTQMQLVWVMTVGKYQDVPVS